MPGGSRALYFQPPVGNRSYATPAIGYSSRGRDRLAFRTNRDVHFYSTGTMALAAAVKLAIELRPVRRPRVIVPGYRCPDVVAAVRFAGAEPEYVDMAPHSTNMDKFLLAKAFDRAGDDAVALIGVDLFGLPEEWPELTTIARRYNALAIQDCAQSVQAPDAYPEELSGDVATFSFGRGKPVCCMSGGAMLTRPDVGSAVPEGMPGGPSALSVRVRSTLYNLLLHPRPYALLAAVMGNRLGATRYIPLERIESSTAPVAQVLDSAVMNYWRAHRDCVKVVFESLDKIVRGSESVPRWPVNLNTAMCQRRLSRLPLLVKRSELRDRLQSELIANGISATTMYKRSLPEIVADYDGNRTEQKVPSADEFAAQLLTLPVHERIRQTDIEVMQQVIMNAVTHS